MAASRQGPIKRDAPTPVIPVSLAITVGDVPRGLTVQATEDWVGDDKDRARVALELERTKPSDEQRSTLVVALEELVNDENKG